MASWQALDSQSERFPHIGDAKKDVKLCDASQKVQTPIKQRMLWRVLWESADVKSLALMGEEGLCSEVLEQRTLRWGKKKGKKKKKKALAGGGRQSQTKRGRNCLSCWSLFVHWIESVSSIVTPVCGGVGEGLLPRGGWNGLLMSAGFKRDDQPAFSWLGPTTAPGEAYGRVKVCIHRDGPPTVLTP